VTNTHSWLTVWGAQCIFGAASSPADLPLARSLVWNIPTIGILMNVVGLFAKSQSRALSEDRKMTIGDDFVDRCPKHVTDATTTFEAFV